jgi:hypothetical protein
MARRTGKRVRDIDAKAGPKARESGEAVGPKKRGGVTGHGSMKGEIRIRDGFDEPLEEFADYER